MNEIKIYLKQSGSTAELYKDFNLYQGSYRNVKFLYACLLKSYIQAQTIRFITWCKQVQQSLRLTVQKCLR